MKIKIIPRWEHHLAEEGCETKLYDVYHGFTYLFFFTKWKLDKAGLDKIELNWYLERLVFDYSPMVVPKISIEI